MGKTVKTVLKVAAFVAIATFAAPVAAAIGLSAVVGTVAGAAVVGAAAGAATNGILGGGVLNGAIMGGLGGALGGLGKVLSTGTGILGDAYATTSSVAEGAVAAPAAAAGVAAPAATTAADVAAAGGFGAPAVAGGTAGAAGGLGAAAPGLAENVINVTAPAAAGGGAGISAAAPTLAAAGVAAPKAADDAFLREATGGPLGTPTTVASGATAPVTSTVAAAPKAGLLANVGHRLGDVATAVAPQLISTALAGGAQGDVTEQQQRMLEEQQRQYNDNFNLKTGYAQDLIDDAGYYDPEVAGRRAAESARIRAGLSASNAARNSNTRRAETIRRQGEIEGGRAATRDYWSAYGTNVGARTQVRAAGINAIPLGSEPRSSDYESLYGRASDDVSGLSTLIGAGIGAWRAGERNEDEVQRRGLG